ncbi:MAG: ABC transporter ATP-binding protein [Alphaproteobacteria bacterium]|nr:ABC transporter ATP-binding protein [Alphaproteobacteria bacterium]MBU1514493.1 ABC transporter ATP-binding protein [Alphaproteobacteria bacterium]MBU2096875.1 ABC transporter ATP-binding protein [Alphaproteobacteria bacterium]MBU2153502.1 ABC transporter ATP-binding protein [Alphaproteobacteria bacterium]MBU2305993.1 ABC transporter ATP-binding protein [Alphaproteobacteria bacterium]
MTAASITCTDLTIRFPVYGADAKSLKKALARAVAVGGALGRHAGVTDVTALSNVNLKLEAGDRLGLIGHNGSGKTTLLRALSGAYEPDDGSIEVNGRIASLLDLSMGIDPSATGYENIRLRCRIGGMSSKDIEGRIDEIAEFTGLGPFLSMPVKTYSAGMQGRLAFAAATAVECDVLLMDEWIAVGDADFQKIAHKRLLKLVERAGILVLATHEAPLLKLYCNKVMKLEGGVASEIVDIRKVDELLKS